MQPKLRTAMLALLAATVSCAFPFSQTTSTPTEEPPLETPPSPTAAPATLTSTPALAPTLTQAPTSTGPAEPQESILILEPGPGSRLVSPARVAGVSDTTFEQHLAVRIVLDDGTELALVPTIIQTEMGVRGPFEVEIPFSITGERQAFIQVYASSPRDGGVTHLASVGVTLAASGAANIVPVSPSPERIRITNPTPNENIQGGMVHVEGVALASFEQTLVIDVYDINGDLVGSQPVIVQAPDVGQPGPFSADVAYTVAQAGAGRVVVRDVSPAFGGDVHLASVEVNLQP